MEFRKMSVASHLYMEEKKNTIPSAATQMKNITIRNVFCSSIPIIQLCMLFVWLVSIKSKNCDSKLQNILLIMTFNICMIIG